MCGIAAILSYNNGIGLACIGAMTNVISHRGPDDEGYAFFCGNEAEAISLAGKDTPVNSGWEAYPYTPRKLFANVVPDQAFAALGHRRLAIVDLSPAGHQPMCTADGRYWIVHNGEVYNYLELRQELENAGYRFNSQTDTEVILNAYRHWGRECLDRFIGMFAFVIFDQKERKILMARDRFGIKPLYYWISPKGFIAIASEIKQFTVLPGWRSELNGQRAYDFLNWGLFDHTGETLFANVRQIRGGEFVECGLSDLDKGLAVERWYNLTHRPFEGGLKDAAISFRQLLSDSVRLRLRADVPIGSCLSGGLDSSSIVCIASSFLEAQYAQYLFKTFSVGSEIGRFDEREFIDEVVKKTGVEAYYTYPSFDELFDKLDAITMHQDEPFLSTSVYAQWHVFRLAADGGVKVMLDGQGADEQLAGYHVFFAPRLSGLFRKLRWRTLFQEIREIKRLHGLEPLYAFKQILNMLLPEVPRQYLRKLGGKASARPSWLDMQLLGAASMDPYFGGGAKVNTVNQLAHSQLTSTCLPMLLHWEDRNSMAHSIESRVPFLDHRLVELVLGFPDEYKLSNGTTKRVLREGMKGLLPEQIRMRMDKMAFATAEEMWIREHAPDTFRAELRRAIDGAQGVLKEGVMEKLEAMISGREPFSFLIWRLISFGRWMKQYNLALQR